MQRFEVSARWMQACGLGQTAKIFDIKDVQDFTLVTASDFFGRMVTVILDDGREWVVAVGRGKFV
jgi:hypothetical protein